MNWITALVICTSALGFSQKQELKSAAKALKSGDTAAASQALATVEGQIENADDKLKAQYYFLQGQSTAADTSLPAQEKAAMAYVKVMEVEKKSGNKKFSADASKKLQLLRENLVKEAIKDQKKEAYSDAAEKLYLGYKTNKRDTSYLYFAASNAINAKDYDKALEYYNELVALDFNGVETEYLATKKEDGKPESFPSKELRDFSVKTGSHIKPEDKVSESKKSEITKNIALIYISQGKDEEALKAMEAAKKANPTDPSLLQAEADMYYKLGNIEKYKELMEQIVANDPNNPDLFYNLGVSASKLGDNEKAKEYYLKTLELKPNYSSAQLNLASLILNGEKELVEQMNALGTTSADYKKYDALKAKRMDIYREAVPYLEGSLESNPDNIEVVRTLMNIFYQLDDSKADSMKNKLKALEGGN
ncbi:tetratricopeptide repeat protein [Aquimarina sp. ERC-38]|uniref:tetratricopeptide repeat protein n=1 Tax=Aquimarina sp. ERC-38 TaxID=2949996 RepID=UPI0022456DBF|nr:tetratricopeptide repeat protein [Aquimarina sp. ERC-38]UZO79547.1 tetratricopeptide repeat protein [Aquimarina sp. ERC-38]